MCEITGCSDKVTARKMCNKHYIRWRKYGNPEYSRIQEICEVEGCNDQHSALGFCVKHYTRFKKHGSVWETRRAEAGAGNINYAGYKRITRKGHPIAQSGGRIFEHRYVLYEAIGPGFHPCHHCNKQVSWDYSQANNTDLCLVVDHLDFDRLNNNISNLVPSCFNCNSYRWRTRRIQID